MTNFSDLLLDNFKEYISPETSNNDKKKSNQQIIVITKKILGQHI